MKLSHFIKLNQRGISHVLVPLVVVVGLAVAGTFALVASHAATPSAKPVTKGWLLIYGNSAYDSVQVHGVNTDAKHKCSGMSSAGTVVKKLSSKKPVKLTCTRINGDSAYKVQYGKNGKFTSEAQAVDIDGGYCSVIHVDQPQAKNKGTCKISKTPIVKVDPAVRILPTLNKKGDTLSGFVEVSIPNKDVERTQCSGQVTFTITAASDAKLTKSYKLPLKLGKDAKAKYASCVAKIRNVKNAKLLKGGETYHLSSTITSRYFNNVPGAKDITLPKAN